MKNWKKGWISVPALYTLSAAQQALILQRNVRKENGTGVVICSLMKEAMALSIHSLLSGSELYRTKTPGGHMSRFFLSPFCSQPLEKKEQGKLLYAQLGEQYTHRSLRSGQVDKQGTDYPRRYVLCARRRVGLHTLGQSHQHSWPTLSSCQQKLSQNKAWRKTCCDVCRAEWPQLHNIGSS